MALARAVQMALMALMALVYGTRMAQMVVCVVVKN